MKDNQNNNRKIKATVGMGIALSAIMLSVSVDDIKADEINIEPPVASIAQTGNNELEIDSTGANKKQNETKEDKFKNSKNTEELTEINEKNSAEKPVDITKADKKNSAEKPEDITKADKENSAEKPIDITKADKENSTEKPVDITKAGKENSTEKPADITKADKENSVEKPVDIEKADEIMEEDHQEEIKKEQNVAAITENKVPGIYLIKKNGERVMYRITDSTDINSPKANYQAIKGALEDEDCIALEIEKDINVDLSDGNLKYTNSQSTRNEFDFRIKEGIIVTINSKEKQKAFEINLGESGVFNLENYGKLIVNDSNSAIKLSGGKNSIFTLSGNYSMKNDNSSAYENDDNALVDGTMFINKNQGYAIDANQGGGFSGTFNFKDIKLITDSTGPEGDASNADHVNGESAVYIGNNKNVRLNIENSRLDLRNNDVGNTSCAFMSNAGVINIDDSIINSSSKAHYNFNPHSAENNNEQKVNFNNSELNLNTPKDSNPYVKKKFFGFELKKLRDSVAVNSANTTFTFNNSKLTHNTNGYDKTRISTIELSQSRLVSNNSELYIPHLGFDYDNKYDPNTPIKEGESRANPGVEINGESKVTIDKINSLVYNDFFIAPIDDTIKEIVINGGSVKLPMKDGTNTPDLPTKGNKTTKVVNSEGVELTHFVIPTKNVDVTYFEDKGEGNFDLKVTKTDGGIPESSGYLVNSEKLHEDGANIWYPKATVIYNGPDKTPIKDMKEDVPKGTSIGILGKNVPTEVKIGDKTYKIGNEPGEYQWRIIKEDKFTDDGFTDDTAVVPDMLNVGLVMNWYKITPIPDVGSDGPEVVTEGDKVEGRTVIDNHIKEANDEKDKDGKTVYGKNLPEGSKVEIIEGTKEDGTVDTGVTGEKIIKVKVTFKDGSSRIVTQKVIVKPRPSTGGGGGGSHHSNPQPQPERPDPERPDPEKPEPVKPEPEKPEAAKPAPERPEQIKPEPVITDSKKNNIPERVVMEKEIPKTGVDTDTVITGLLAGIGTILAIFFKDRKRKGNQ